MFDQHLGWDLNEKQLLMESQKPKLGEQDLGTFIPQINKNTN